MKNNSNIYDIDGDLIRHIDDTHEFSIEEAQKQMEKYRKKLEELPENDPKAPIYNTYLRNLSNYLVSMYLKSPKPEIKTDENDIRRAIQQLSEDIDGGGGTTMDKEVEQSLVEHIQEKLNNSEEKPVTQDSLLVERDGVVNNMDEYVQFEELPDSDESSKEYKEV